VVAYGQVTLKRKHEVRPGGCLPLALGSFGTAACVHSNAAQQACRRDVFVHVLHQAELLAAEEKLAQCHEANARYTPGHGPHVYCNLATLCACLARLAERCQRDVAMTGCRLEPRPDLWVRRSLHSGYSRRLIRLASARGRPCRGYRAFWTSTGREL
jgi:hypothetical protein